MLIKASAIIRWLRSKVVQALDGEQFNFFIIFTTDVNECSNIRIPFEYSNTISEFEYSHFFCPCPVLLLILKNYRPALKGGIQADNLPS